MILRKNKNKNKTKKERKKNNYEENDLMVGRSIGHTQHALIYVYGFVSFTDSVFVTSNDELLALLFSYPAWTRSDLPARYCAVFDEGYPTALLVIYLRKERRTKKQKKHIFETYHRP
jgi:hypothetical protein